MSSYHINPATGEVGVCRAKLKCRFGSPEEHHSTQAEARRAYEVLQNQQTDDGLGLTKASKRAFDSAAAAHQTLSSLGLDLKPLGEQPLWSNSTHYAPLFTELTYELERLFTTGGGGQEKVMFTSEELPYVVKIAAAEEGGDFYSGSEGMTSLFEEAAAGTEGLNGEPIFASGQLLWHQSGAPLLLQEKLFNLQIRLPKELQAELPWLPASYYNYAQVGQDSQGDWKLFDLDAGSTADFYPTYEEGERAREAIYKRYIADLP